VAYTPLCSSLGKRFANTAASQCTSVLADPNTTYMCLHPCRFEFPVVSLDKQVQRICPLYLHVSRV
jgi:hypothetical protein